MLLCLRMLQCARKLAAVTFDGGNHRRQIVLQWPRPPPCSPVASAPHVAVRLYGKRPLRPPALVAKRFERSAPYTRRRRRLIAPEATQGVNRLGRRAPPHGKSYYVRSCHKNRCVARLVVTS